MPYKHNSTHQSFACCYFDQLEVSFFYNFPLRKPLISSQRALKMNTAEEQFEADQLDDAAAHLVDEERRNFKLIIAAFRLYK